MAKKPQQRGEGIVELRVFIPGDLRNKFKGKCATQGKTMSEVITALMDKYVTGEITPEILAAEDKK
ncbi:hypothetical protein HW132_28320 [Brasilonema sp. CT11]|nr:hypothetical protein [Brasilonema sp. CT11]